MTIKIMMMKTITIALAKRSLPFGGEDCLVTPDALLSHRAVTVLSEGIAMFSL
jgi:hypothetical protein